MIKLGSKELRKTAPKEGEITQIKRNPIYLVLDRVIDTYNIGSIFRLADAIAAEKIYICGDTEYPPSSRIHKAAVGTEESQRRDDPARACRIFGVRRFVCGRRVVAGSSAKRTREHFG